MIFIYPKWLTGHCGPYSLRVSAGKPATHKDKDSMYRYSSISEAYEISRDRALGHRGPYAEECEEDEVKWPQREKAPMNRILPCKAGEIGRVGEIYQCINKAGAVVLTIECEGWYDWRITNGTGTRRVRSIGEAQTAVVLAGFSRRVFHRLAHRLP